MIKSSGRNSEGADSEMKSHQNFFWAIWVASTVEENLHTLFPLCVAILINSINRMRKTSVQIGIPAIVSRCKTFVIEK